MQILLCFCTGGSAERNLRPTSCSSCNSGSPSGYGAVSYPRSYENYVCSTLSQNLVVSKRTDKKKKNASTPAVSHLGYFSLEHTFNLLLLCVPSEITHFTCISLICIDVYTAPLEIWVFFFSPSFCVDEVCWIPPKIINSLEPAVRVRLRWVLVLIRPLRASALSYS